MDALTVDPPTPSRAPARRRGPVRDGTGPEEFAAAVAAVLAPGRPAAAVADRPVVPDPSGPSGTRTAPSRPTRPASSVPPHGGPREGAATTARAEPGAGPAGSGTAVPDPAAPGSTGAAPPSPGGTPAAPGAPDRPAGPAVEPGAPDPAAVPAAGAAGTGTTPAALVADPPVPRFPPAEPAGPSAEGPAVAPASAAAVDPTGPVPAPVGPSDPADPGPAGVPAHDGDLPPGTVGPGAAHRGRAAARPADDVPAGPAADPAADLPDLRSAPAGTGPDVPGADRLPTSTGGAGGHGTGGDVGGGAGPVVPGLPHPSPPVGTAAPVVASPPAATPPHAGLVGRLVEVVAPLRARGDGTHELTLRVTSPDLGDVDLRIDCRDGVVDVRLRARDPAAGAVLEAALADLRAALAEAGIDAGRLDVGRDPQPGPGGDEPGRPARGRATTEVPSVATTVPTVDPHAGVDVLL